MTSRPFFEQGTFKGRIVKTLYDGDDHVISEVNKTSWFKAFDQLDDFRYVISSARLCGRLLRYAARCSMHAHLVSRTLSMGILRAISMGSEIRMRVEVRKLFHS